ncbi:MAG: SGNH/GDSL hydrolase family protein [Peptostreptococcaceae bacterium]|jgi:phospholipase/lecithinase/hemolysin|nr:SGNH/GDSL hydrolase family protein [Peptostreptococcaceae bacterium]
MKKIFKSLILLIGITTLIFGGCTKAEEEGEDKITKVIAFGDSYSDNGEAKRVTTEIMNLDNPPKNAYIKPSDELYWNNRYSNGNTAVEVFASNLNVELKNYATGGGTTGISNYSAWMDVLGGTGVLGQIKKFENDLLNEEIDENALYFIFASGNDYFYHMDYNIDGEVSEVAINATKNIKKSIEKLADLGAKKFFVVKSTDLSLVPYEITTKRINEAKSFTKTFNQNLEKEIMPLKEKFDVEIMIFDPTKVSDKIVKTPDEYGITVLDKECQSTYPKILPKRDNEDEYYFWDEWHFTKTVHKLLGDAMFEKYKTLK